MIRLLTVLALLLGALAAAPAAQAAPMADTTTCDWHQVFASEITQLDGNLTDWSIAEIDLYGRVDYDTATARINPNTPCHFLADTIKHEWMHLQQVRIHGDVHGHYHGEDDERVADCGAKLLGSETTPYVDAEWDYPSYVGPCRLVDYADALGLIVAGKLGLASPNMGV